MNQINNQQSTINNSALSLVLTLLIISSIITGTVMIGDVMIRHAQIVKSAEISEKAYFAAETAIGKAGYHALKSYADIANCTLDSELDNESAYTATISADDENPATGVTIDPTHPWSINLGAGESFQLDLDINGATYPSQLTISRSSTVPSDLVIYECETQAGSNSNCSLTVSTQVCSSTIDQIFKVSFPYALTIAANKYYKVRINNRSSTLSETYTLTPADQTLPIGVEVSATGIYSGHERKLKSNFPKWQKFGTD